MAEAERATAFAADGVPTLDGVRRHRDALTAAAARYGASNVRVFGSVARGEADTYSDVDFLVDMPGDYSLFDLGGVYTGFEDVIGRSLHVVVAAELPAAWRERALREAVPL